MRVCKHKHTSVPWHSYEGQTTMYGNWLSSSSGLQGDTQVFRLGDYPASHLGEHAFYVLKEDFTLCDLELRAMLLP